jgi:hypothetical protein
MKSEVVRLAPSILAADFARLGEQVAEAEPPLAVAAGPKFPSSVEEGGGRRVVESSVLHQDTIP